MGSNLQAVLTAIEERLQSKKMSVSQAIADQHLYFRVSVLSYCNLSCPFCHNEGGPVHSQDGNHFSLNRDFAHEALKSAYEVGFRRVQYTGGEPLIREDIAEFVGMAREFFEDVGVTTNGELLLKRIDQLMLNGISRIHVSLQSETLSKAGDKNSWGIPTWLQPILKFARQGVFRLRLNLPVLSTDLKKAERLLPTVLSSCDVRVFSILPQVSPKSSSSFEVIHEMVNRVQEIAIANGLTGQVFLRGYKEPTGIRCQSCESINLCKEQSHSLRLGADHILRPCLISRNWDLPCPETYMFPTIYNATLLALDYE